MKITSLLLLSLISTSTFADNHKHHKQKSHEHGSAKLEIAVEGNVIDIDLESPAESILGFEHAPKSDAEKMAYATAENKWKKNLMSDLFVLDKSLECMETENSFKQEMEDHGKKSGTHSEIEAEVKITCKKDPKGQFLTVNLRKHFPKMKKLKIDIVGSTTSSVQAKEIEVIKL